MLRTKYPHLDSLLGLACVKPPAFTEPETSAAIDLTFRIFNVRFIFCWTSSVSMCCAQARLCVCWKSFSYHARPHRWRSLKPTTNTHSATLYCSLELEKPSGTREKGFTGSAHFVNRKEIFMPSCDKQRAREIRWTSGPAASFFFFLSALLLSLCDACGVPRLLYLTLTSLKIPCSPETTD